MLYEDVLFPEGENWEDVATTFYPVSKAKKIAVLGKPLYHYRQRVGAITKEAVKDGSAYKWRFLQYRKRYEFLKNYYPRLADIAKESLFKNGLLYYSVCLQEKDNNQEQSKVYEYLCSREFDDGIANQKLRFARAGFKLCPSVISYFIKKNYSAEKQN